MTEHPGTGGDGWGYPRTGAEVLKILACDIKREVLVELKDRPADVSTLAERICREIPHASKAITSLMRASLVNISHVKKYHICSLTEWVVVRHEGGATFIEITALSGEQIIYRLGPPESGENR
jgi:hypothetical protein